MKRLMLKKIVTLLLLASIVLTSVFTGCKQKEKSDLVQEDSSAKLTIWTYGWVKGANDAIIADADEYTKKTGVTIEIVPLSVDNFNTKLSATIAGGQNPDVAFMDSNGLASYEETGTLLDLSQYGVSQYEDKFYKPLWDSMIYKDKIYGMRITSNNLALFYNKELFDKANLDYPTSDWTWDDLKKAAKELTNESEQVFGLELPIAGGDYGWTWLPFLWQSGGAVLNEDNTASAINSPEAAEALKFWKDLINEKVVPVQAAVNGVDRFASEKVAMTINGTWMVSSYLNDPNFKNKFDVVQLPHYKEKATIAGGECVVAFSNTKYPEEAAAYVAHLTTDSIAQTIWTEWGSIPPITEFADIYKDQEIGKYLVPFTEQMNYVKTSPNVSEWKQISNEMKSGFEQYMLGDKDLNDVLKNTSDIIDEILKNE